MKLRHLRYFVTIAEERHFRRAADRLNVSQPPLSKQIKELEEELGVQLFERNNRKVALTDEGELFLRRARAILENVEDARTEMHAFAVSGGSISLGYMSAAMASSLPTVLRAFRAQSTSVNVKLHQLPPDAQFRSIASGVLDAGFVDLVARDAAITIDEKALVIEQAWQESVMVALPPDHALAREGVIALKQLALESFIVMARNPLSGFFDQAISRCFTAGIRPRIVHEAMQFPEIMTLVAAGYGVSFAPERSSALWQSQVALVPLKEDIPTDVSLIYRTDNRSPILARFREAVKASRTASLTSPFADTASVSW